ncbi:MAG: NADH-quinone oxidoreductase subunit C [Spirochaetes bacterium]|nr:NADH-quinone oxidoreductase subunit C [Spirochaetota bacterium]
MASREKIKEYASGVSRITLWISIDRESFHHAVGILKTLGRLHISTPMPYKEYEDRIELIYPFALKMKDARFSEVMVILSVDVPKEDLMVRTITDIVPGALFMEREAMEMIGVAIEDIPDPRRLFTGNYLPDGFYPLRESGKKEILP